MSTTSRLPDLLVFDLDDTLLDHKSAETAALGQVHAEFEDFAGVALAEWVGAYRKANARLWTAYAQGSITRADLQRRRFLEPMEALGLLRQADGASGNAAAGLDGAGGGHEERIARIGTTYMARYRGHWDWMPGAEDAYHALAARIPTGILTNGFLETQKLKCDQFGFWDSARKVVISEEVGVMKPDRRIFDHMRGEIPAEKVLYVGDSLHSDIRDGAAAGWRTAWYRRPPVEPSSGMEAGVAGGASGASGASGGRSGAAAAEELQDHGAELVFSDFRDLMRWLGVG